MSKHILIAVDGGATKSLVRIEDGEHRLIGEAIGGPASIRLSVPAAWDSIVQTSEKILNPHDIYFHDEQFQFHLSAGLAGCELAQAKEDFHHHNRWFKTVNLIPDSHAACIGAHKGADGAIIIIGTGTVGYQKEQQQISKVGGWGFPHDDAGGGAWLGMKAAGITLQYLDGRQPGSLLSTLIFSYFNNQHDHFVTWANRANPTAFAVLAPFVIKAAELNDGQAIRLLEQAAQAINQIDLALSAKVRGKQTLPCVLVGSVAPFIVPYLAPSLKHKLIPAQGTPAEGAMLLLRTQLDLLSAKESS